MILSFHIIPNSFESTYNIPIYILLLKEERIIGMIVAPVINTRNIVSSKEANIDVLTGWVADFTVAERALTKRRS